MSAAVPIMHRRPVGTLLMDMYLGRDIEQVPTLYEAVGEVDAYVLASMIFDSRRDRPLVVLTVGRAQRTAPDARAIAARAHPHAWVVVARNPEVVRALCAAIPSWLDVYDGQARVFMPAADISDDHRRHPLVRADWHRPEAMAQHIVKLVHRAHARRDDDPARRLAREEAAHAETRAALSKARQDLAAAAKTEDTAAIATVFSDPAAQFDHELYLTWLTCTPECDRDQWALRPYTLGPEFLDSLHTMREHPRPHILRACVDVVTGRYAEINSRNAKHAGQGKASQGVVGRTVRPADRAVAWRCAVANNTPNAPRLLWWEVPGGDPELGRVAAHDDFRIA